jgi:hypothetical protein
MLGMPHQRQFLLWGRGCGNFYTQNRISIFERRCEREGGPLGRVTHCSIDDIVVFGMHEAVKFKGRLRFECADE